MDAIFANKAPEFIERRKEFRLPFREKVLFTDGTNTVTAYAANISRGGLFLMSLQPYPLDTICHFAFFLSTQPQSLCVKAKIAHIVFDRQRCEVECGMGIQFKELNESQKSLINLHILNEQQAYQDLRAILNKGTPRPVDLAPHLRKLPHLERLDLLELRYRVNRICTLFEPVRDPQADGRTEKMSA